MSHTVNNWVTHVDIMNLFLIVLYAAKISIMFKRTHYTEVRVTVKIVYPVLIKVRAYTRIRFGKVEKVRSHYRRYWGIEK